APVARLPARRRVAVVELYPHGRRQRQRWHPQRRPAALRLEVGTAGGRLQLEQRESPDDVAAVDVQVDGVGGVDLPALLDGAGRTRRRLEVEQRLCRPRRVVDAEGVARPDRRIAEVRERRARRVPPAPAELVTVRRRPLRELQLRGRGRTATGRWYRRTERR